MAGLIDVATASAVGELAKAAVTKGLTLLENNFSSNLKGFGKYKDNYIKYCANFLKIKTIASEKDIYIEDIYVPLEILKSGHTLPFDINSNTTLDETHAILIKGIAGQGKSTILRKLLSNNLRKGARLPLFYELKNYKGGDIETALSAQLKIDGIEIPPDKVGQLLRDSNVIVFLDAFDEAHPDYRNELIDEIKKLSNLYKCHILCTTRPETEIDTLTSFDTYTVRELNEKQIFQIIHKVASDNDKADELCNALKRSELHSQKESVLKTPILVTLYCISYNLGENIPDTLSQFYSNIFETVFYKHDNLKSKVNRRRHWNDNRQIYKELFRTLCFASQRTGLTNYSGETLNTLIANSLSAIQQDRNLADIISNEIRTITNLIIEDGYNDYRFVHKSIQEYFSAVFVYNLPLDKKVQFYRNCRSKLDMYNLFSTTITFLRELDYYDFCEYFLQPSVSDLLNLNGGPITENLTPPEALIDFYLDNITISSRLEKVTGINRKVTTQVVNSTPILTHYTSCNYLHIHLFRELSSMLMACSEPKYTEMCDAVRAEGQRRGNEAPYMTLRELIEKQVLTKNTVVTFLVAGIAISFMKEYNQAISKLEARRYSLNNDDLFNFD